MTRTGLVLGAGGVVGQAYEAGVLAALEHDLGWDPRTADVIVGTSAGSVTGTLLRLGVAAHDLAAFAVEAPLTVEGAPVLEHLSAAREPFPPLRAADFLRPWRMPSPALLLRLAQRPWAFRPSVAAMTLLPAGKVDITERANLIDDLVGGAWPAGLLVCAVRRRDGARVVFGRPGSPPAPLSRAVAASCAIPGYFAPIPVHGVEYIDGGVYSPSNADVLRDERLDLVVIVSPMSAANGRAATLDALYRYGVHRRLEREVRKLRATGTKVVRIEPGPHALAAMGLNAMAEDRSDRVVQAAFVEAGRYASQARIDGRLAPLVTRPGRRRPAAPG